MFACGSNSEVNSRLEGLLNDWVDLYISGNHEHYERSYPVANNKKASASSNKKLGEHYTNPKAPIYVEGGLSSAVSPPSRECQKEWSAIRDKRAGYGKIRIESSSIFESLLEYSYVDASSGEVIDKFTIQRKL